MENLQMILPKKYAGATPGRWTTLAEMEANDRLKADSPRLAAAVVELRAEVAYWAAQIALENGLCHAGIVRMEDCGRCSPILRARAILAATSEWEA